MSCGVGVGEEYAGGMDMKTKEDELWSWGWGREYVGGMDIVDMKTKEIDG